MPLDLFFKDGQQAARFVESMGTAVLAGPVMETNRKVAPAQVVGWEGWLPALNIGHYHALLFLVTVKDEAGATIRVEDLGGDRRRTVLDMRPARAGAGSAPPVLRSGAG